MGVRINAGFAALAVALCMPLCAAAQQEEPAPVPEGQEQPEEVVVVGQRFVLQLRVQMMEAEVKAYNIFNEFNDEKRFDISCSTQQATGSRILSDTQYCQPEFELQAMRGQGQDYLASYRAFMDPFSEDKNAAPVNAPAAMVIASQQKEYRDKMKQVAEEHPEFLEAIIQYSEIRARYEDATRKAAEGSKGSE